MTLWKKKLGSFVKGHRATRSLFAAARLRKAKSTEINADGKAAFWQQGDASLYTDEAVAQRAAIRSHDQVLLLLQQWWDTALRSVNNGPSRDAPEYLVFLTKEPYKRMMKKMYIVLIEDWDEDDADQCAEEDWQTDARGSDELSRQQFCDALFELADTWTRTCEAEEYVEFLASLFEAITIRKTTADGVHSYFWKEDRDIQYNPKFELASSSDEDGGPASSGSAAGPKSASSNRALSPQRSSARRSAKAAAGGMKRGFGASGLHWKRLEANELEDNWRTEHVELVNQQQRSDAMAWRRYIKLANELISRTSPRPNERSVTFTDSEWSSIAMIEAIGSAVFDPITYRHYVEGGEGGGWCVFVPDANADGGGDGGAAPAAGKAVTPSTPLQRIGAAAASLFGGGRSALRHRMSAYQVSAANRSNNSGVGIAFGTSRERFGSGKGNGPEKPWVPSTPGAQFGPPPPLPKRPSTASSSVSVTTARLAASGGGSINNSSRRNSAGNLVSTAEDMIVASSSTMQAAQAPSTAAATVSVLNLGYSGPSVIRPSTAASTRPATASSPSSAIPTLRSNSTIGAASAFARAPSVSGPTSSTHQASTSALPLAPPSTPADVLPPTTEQSGGGEGGSPYGTRTTREQADATFAEYVAASQQKQGGAGGQSFAVGSAEVWVLQPTTTSTSSFGAGGLSTTSFGTTTSSSFGTSGPAGITRPKPPAPLPLTQMKTATRSFAARLKPLSPRNLLASTRSPKRPFAKSRPTTAEATAPAPAMAIGARPQTAGKSGLPPIVAPRPGTAAGGVFYSKR